MQLNSPRTFQKLGHNCGDNLRSCRGHCRSAPSFASYCPQGDGTSPSQLLSNRDDKSFESEQPEHSPGTERRQRASDPQTGLEGDETGSPGLNRPRVFPVRIRLDGSLRGQSPSPLWWGWILRPSFGKALQCLFCASGPRSLAAPLPQPRRAACRHPLHADSTGFVAVRESP